MKAAQKHPPIDGSKTTDAAISGSIEVRPDPSALHKEPGELRAGLEQRVDQLRSECELLRRRFDVEQGSGMRLVELLREFDVLRRKLEEDVQRLARLGIDQELQILRLRDELESERAANDRLRLRGASAQAPPPGWLPITPRTDLIQQADQPAGADRSSLADVESVSLPSGDFDLISVRDQQAVDVVPVEPTPSSLTYGEALGIALDHTQDKCESSLSQLRQQGTVLSGEATGSGVGVRVCLGTDIGPPQADKHSNQDRVFALIPESVGESLPGQFALAIADGVSSSLHAELGAELATATALGQLYSDLKGATEPGRVVSCFETARRAVSELHTASFARSVGSPPADIKRMTWSKKYLAEGRLLQTTLALCWCDGHVVYFVGLGDAGISVEWLGSSGQRIRQCLVECGDDSTVDAIGPLRAPITLQDLIIPTQSLSRDHHDESHGQLSLHRIAVYTDGVARGMRNDADLLFDNLPMLRAGTRGNPAMSFLRSAMAERPQELEDNLTIALIQLDTNEPKSRGPQLDYEEPGMPREERNESWLL